jgi:hypothetical protein
MFLRGPCWDIISKGTESVESEFYTASCEEKPWAREAEKSLLLEAVARERLVKTQQAGKGFSTVTEGIQ